jgi:hypothetical protein
MCEITEQIALGLARRPSVARATITTRARICGRFELWNSGRISAQVARVARMGNLFLSVMWNFAEQGLTGYKAFGI